MLSGKTLALIRSDAFKKDCEENPDDFGDVTCCEVGLRITLSMVRPVVGVCG